MEICSQGKFRNLHSAWFIRENMTDSCQFPWINRKIKQQLPKVPHGWKGYNKISVCIRIEWRKIKRESAYFIFGRRRGILNEKHRKKL